MVAVLAAVEHGDNVRRVDVDEEQLAVGVGLLWG
jgi:hypothetical protein